MITKFYKHSLLCKIISRLAEIIMFFWHGSFVKRLLFSDFGLNAAFERGLLGRFFAFVFKPFSIAKHTKHTEKPQKGLVGLFAQVFDNLADTGSRYFGLACVAFGLSAGVTSVIVREGITLMFYAACAMFVAGVLLFLLNRTPRSLYEGSFVCRLIGGLFVSGAAEMPPTCSPPANKLNTARGVWFVYGVLGGAFGGAAGALAPIEFLMVFFVFIAFFVVMWKTEAGVLALAFLLPLVPTALIVGVCALTILSFAVKTVVTRTAAFTFKLTDLFVLLFAFMLVYGYVISFNREGSVFMVSMYLLFIAAYFAVKNTIANTANPQKFIFAVFATLTASGMLVALYGVYQQLTGNFTPAAAWLDATMFGGGGRIYSTLDNPNVLGQYLIFTILISMALMYIYTRPVYKIAAFGVFGVAALCMVFTQSRGAWLGLIFAVAVFAFLKDRRLIALGLIALLFMPVALPDSIIDRFLSIGNMADTSTMFRVHIWQASVLMIRDFWLSGIGLGEGAFTRIYQMYAFNAVLSPHSHNLYLQIIIEIGIVGITVFFAVVVCFFKNTLLAVKHMGKNNALAAALCAAMTGYLIQGLTDHVFYNYRITAFFWFCIALSASLLINGSVKNEN